MAKTYAINKEELMELLSYIYGVGANPQKTRDDRYRELRAKYDEQVQADLA